MRKVISIGIRKIITMIILLMSTCITASAHYHISQYVYCGGNPVNAIDPDGRDYWATNDLRQIIQFLNAIGSGNTQFDFSGWNHTTDAELCGILVYNDVSHKFYTSYAEVTNGELVVTSKSYDANITPVSATGVGYPGAFVYEPVNGFWDNANYYLSGLRYNDDFINWNVNGSGRITGVAPITGMPPSIGFKGGKQLEKMGRAFRNMSGNRNVQQKQIDQLCSKYQLSKKQRRELHDNIHGEGLSYKEIEKLIIELFY